MAKGINKLMAAVAISKISADNENYQIGFSIKDGIETIKEFKRLEADIIEKDKRIAELEANNKKLKEENEFVAAWMDENHELKEQVAELEAENKELKEKLEKYKYTDKHIDNAYEKGWEDALQEAKEK